jgi:hypothetical protein
MATIRGRSRNMQEHKTHFCAVIVNNTCMCKASARYMCNMKLTITSRDVLASRKLGKFILGTPEITVKNTHFRLSK